MSTYLACAHNILENLLPNVSLLLKVDSKPVAQTASGCRHITCSFLQLIFYFCNQPIEILVLTSHSFMLLDVSGISSYANLSTFFHDPNEIFFLVTQCSSISDLIPSFAICDIELKNSWFWVSSNTLSTISIERMIHTFFFHLNLKSLHLIWSLICEGLRNLTLNIRILHELTCLKIHTFVLFCFICLKDSYFSSVMFGSILFKDSYFCSLLC